VNAYLDQDRGEVTRERLGRTPWKLDGCPMTYSAVAPGPGGFLAAWPPEWRIFFAGLDRKGEQSGRAEIETPERSSMRTGVLALTAPDGITLVAWKQDGRLG
jgi:hypothetical protein